MLKCDAQFSQRTHQVSNGVVEGRQGPNSPALLEPYYLSLANFKLAFFADADAKEPVFETAAKDLRTKLDTGSGILILTPKKIDVGTINIRADVSSLEKIRSYCRAINSDYTTLNPLVCGSKESSGSEEKSKGDSNSYLSYLMLGGTVLLTTQIKDIITNYLQYGLLGLSVEIIPHPAMFAYALSWSVLATLVMIATEKLAFKKIISNSTAAVIGLINILIAFYIPADFCHRFKPDTLAGMFYVNWSTMMILKLISYMHFMHELRSALPKILTPFAKESPELYISKDNLKIVEKHEKDLSGLVNVKDILYFYFVPTLVYQLSFPRTEKIRRGYALKLAVGLVCLLLFELVWLNQLFIPIVKQAGIVFRTGTFLQKLEILLHMANSFAVLMPVMTYTLFHVFTNLVAEIFRFGDRDFCQDWWNCDRIRNFWNRWNRPVHKWCQRHVYYLLLKKGFSRTNALYGVFIFSGLMHEYLISTPARVFVLYALGLVSQAPLIIKERKHEKFCERYGKINFVAWAWSTLR